MEKTILITGAGGMIGRKLRAHFDSLGGYSLRLLSRTPVPNENIVGVDLSEYNDDWARSFDGVDSVIHLAGAPSPASDWATVQRYNVDLTLNVFRAAEAYGARRIIFASSNWIMAGHRFAEVALTTALQPAPINPYGASKLFIERAGRDFSARTGISFIAFRIGYNQHTEGNIPGPQMAHGLWGQQMWLGDHDLCVAHERALQAENVSYAVLNLMSDNLDMRWDMTETERVIGFRPIERYAPLLDPAATEHGKVLKAFADFQERFTNLTLPW